MAEVGLTEAAGRAAYLGAYHAAQAFIFHHTGKIAKTHSGVRSQFARLAKDEPGVDQAFSAFLGRAYKFKSIADYMVGRDVGVTIAEAEHAIDIAGRCIDCIASLVVCNTNGTMK